MPDLITDVGSATANSFVDVDAADEYLDTRLNAAAWNSTASAEDKARALIEATRELSLLTWAGTRTDNVQALSWPRTNVVNPDNTLGEDFDDDVIPDRVVKFTCELALAFLKAGVRDLAGTNPDAGLISKTTDVLSKSWEPGTHLATSAGVKMSDVPRFSFIQPLLAANPGGQMVVIRV